jgi:hypothetical protein
MQNQLSTLETSFPDADLERLTKKSILGVLLRVGQFDVALDCCCMHEILLKGNNIENTQCGCTL